MDTPYVLLDRKKLQHNIDAMAAFAAEHGVKLRPHAKAHKLPQVAQLQIKAGACGITVAKLSEAEAMFAAGIEDILLAYPLVGESKLARAKNLLAAGCKLSLLVDSRFGAQQIAALNTPKGTDVLVKVDSGLHRCGLEPGPQLDSLVSWLQSLPGINLRGLLTHAGHVYGCSDAAAVAEIGRQEGELMVQTAAEMRARGIPIDEVSIGATPTVFWGAKALGVTEIRPGNYVFYDATQVSLGVVGAERCSLRVIATIVSRPTRHRGIIDAGAKILALDQGAHGSPAVRGYGLLENPHWQLIRLSEEHGVVEGPGLPPIGSEISIIPNHACPVINLVDRVWLDDGQSWNVAARGKSW